MLDNKMIDAIRFSLQRIFSITLSKSTFREIQNTIRASTNNNSKLSELVMEALLSKKLLQNKI